MPDISNDAVAEALREIGEYLEMQDVPFKPRAYEKAALTVGGLETQAAEIYKKDGVKGLMGIPGIGMGIAQKIEELLTTGRVKERDELAKKVPVNLRELSGIEGLGPKTIKKLYQTLGVKNRADLARALKAGKVAGLAGFGKKSEEKITKNLGFAAGNTRFILGDTAPAVHAIIARLEKIKGVTRVAIAGSARRKKETIGDADILLALGDHRAPGGRGMSPTATVMESFVSMPDVVNVIAHGDTKSSVKLRSGLNVDLRVVPKKSYGAALNYFTGSKDHNVALRQIALKKGWKLNEYGLFKTSRGGGSETMIAGASEEELYKKFGMDYIEPELRENTGEIKAALRHSLPKLVGYGDLQGDLQTQTDWTDGADSIEVMARAAAARGLKYIVITDHTKRLAMTHGLDEKRLLKQMAEIDRLNKKLAGKIKILKGSECDILKDGTLDLSDAALSRLDVVGVSVHSHFNLSRADQTARVLRAIANPNADILFHPTGRIINRRPPIELDMDAVITAAKKTGTVMEVNSFPERADLKDEHVRACVDLGVKLAIDSDGHAVRHFDLLEWGIAQARRGWAERKDVINAWPLEKMLGSLKKGK